MTKCTPQFNEETRKLQAQLKDLQRIDRGAKKGDFGEAIRAKAKEFAKDESLSSQDVLNKTHEYINQYAPHSLDEVSGKITGSSTVRTPRTKTADEARLADIKKELRAEEIKRTNPPPADRPKDPSAVYNQRRMAQLENERKEIEDRIASGKYEKDDSAKPVVTKSNEVLAAERELAASKHELDKLRHSVELKNRSFGRKTADLVLGSIRASILSGYHVLGKLAAYSAVELPSKILHAAVSEAYRHIPKLGDIFEKAPDAGGGLNWNAEKALYASLKDPEMRKAAWQRLTRGFSDWDAMYGEKADFQVTHPWLEFFGRLHNAIKTPTEFASMQRSKILYDAQMIRELQKEGLGHEEIMDQVNSPVAQGMNWAKAYIRGKESVLKGDNVVVNGYKGLIRILKGKEGDSRSRVTRALAYFMESQTPIVKVPTNIAGRVIDYTPVGAIKALAASKELKNMSEGEAEYIAKNLVHSTVGAAALTAFWLYRHHFTGFYQQGDAKKNREAETLDNVKATKVAFHHPLTMLAQMVGTIGRIYDETRGTPLQKLAVGTTKGYLGVLEQVPFSPLKGQEDAFKNADSMGKLAGREASTFVPGLLNDIAQDTDPKKNRTARTGVDAIKKKIPGLRETLPGS